MAVTQEILRTYRAPRAVLRRQLDAGTREDRALIYLFVACLLIFVSALPHLARQAHLDPSVPLDARIGGALLGWLFIAPLLFYAIAALTHLAARLLGGAGSWFSVRMALFWTLLSVAPLWLFYGLVAGFIGKGPAHSAVALLLAGCFLYIWAATLREAETAPEG
ncbi:YIP1 family protein [Actibacterium sp. D379-3]